MKKYKFKVGDIIIGIENDLEYPDINIVGKIGEITEVKDFDSYYDYSIKFKDIICECDNSYVRHCNAFKEDEIVAINKIKLKKLLED